MIHRSQGRELLKSYLLGVASAAEREAVEDEYFADGRSVRRLLRAEDELIEDYARGALTPRERALFEKNFLCTDERRKRLASLQELRESLSAVARHVSLEHRKRGAPALSLRESVIADAEEEGPAEGELAHECVEKCLGQLSADDRDLLLSYYRFEGRNKVANRKHLAESLGISQNALRLRTYRLTVSLRNCVTSCLEQAKETG